MNDIKVRQLNKDIKKFIIDLKEHTEMTNYLDNREGYFNDLNALEDFGACDIYLDWVVSEYDKEK